MLLPLRKKSHFAAQLMALGWFKFPCTPLHLLQRQNQSHANGGHHQLLNLIQSHLENQRQDPRSMMTRDGLTSLKGRKTNMIIGSSQKTKKKGGTREEREIR